MPTFRCILGDCLIILPTLPAHSIDCVIVDLPYGETACAWDTCLDLKALWLELQRVATDEHVPFVFWTSTKFGCQLLVSQPQWYRHTIVVEKKNPSNWQHANHAPLKKHDLIYVFSVKRAFYQPQCTTGPAYSTNRDCAKSNILTPHKRCHSAKKVTKRFPLSILQSKEYLRKKGNHPTQKPVDISLWLIKSYCREGGTVLDPCAGSGTTGVAARLTGRSFVGIEKERLYYHKMQERIRNKT